MEKNFELVTKDGKSIMIGPTIDGRVSILIDEDANGATFDWRLITLTEDETKAVRRALMTAIATNNTEKE